MPYLCQGRDLRHFPFRPTEYGAFVEVRFSGFRAPHNPDSIAYPALLDPACMASAIVSPRLLAEIAEEDRRRGNVTKLETVGGIVWAVEWYFRVWLEPDPGLTPVCLPVAACGSRPIAVYGDRDYVILGAPALEGLSLTLDYTVAAPTFSLWRP